MPKTDSGIKLFNDCVTKVKGNKSVVNLFTKPDEVSFVDCINETKKPRTQMVIELPNNRKVRVMTRFLDSAGGSVKEKFPYFIECAKYCVPENEVIILLDGDGYSKNKNLLTYVKNSINPIKVFNLTKIIKLYDVKMFENWINNGLGNI